MVKPEFKLLQFKPAQKKKAREQFISSLMSYFKDLFKRDKGYTKYRFVSWIFYTNIGKTAVTYQNIKTGVCREYIFPVQGRLDWPTIDTWLRNKS